MYQLKSKFKKIEKKFDKLYNSTFYSIEFLQKVLFYLGTIFLFLHRCWDYTPYEPLLKIRHYFIYIAIVLLILKICITKESLLKYIKFLFLIVIAFVCDNITKSNYKVVSIILYIVATRNIDIKSIFKFHFIFSSCFIFSNVILYTCTEFLEIHIPNLSSIEYVYRDEVLRHGFYFFHPNAFSFYLFFAYVIYIYLHYDKINLMHKKNLFLHFGISIFLAFFCSFFMKTRVATILFLGLIPLLLIFQNRKITNTKLFKVGIPLTYVIIFIVSFLLVVCYNQENLLGTIAEKINKIISGRLDLANKALTDYGITVFGGSLSSLQAFVIDNGYFYLLLKSGILVSFFIFWYFTKTLYFFTEKKRFSELYVMFIFCIYCFIEALFIHPIISFPFAFLGLFI